MHHPFLSCFFHILGAGEKSSPQESKDSVGLSASIADTLFHLKSLVTPRYLMFSTFSRTVPSIKGIGSLNFICNFFVSCIMLHLTGWNLIPHFLAQLPNQSIFLLKFQGILYVLVPCPVFLSILVPCPLLYCYTKI